MSPAAGEAIKGSVLMAHTIAVSVRRRDAHETAAVAPVRAS